MGFTKVAASGITTDQTFVFTDINASGVITATSFSGDGSNLSNTGSTLSAASGSQRVVLTSQTSGTMTASSTDADLAYNASTNTLSVVNFSASGNVSIAGTLTYEDVTNVDSIGLITARSGVKVQTGSATTALVVEGDTRVTGILTIGTSSITLDGSNNQVNVGTGITLHHTDGVQVGSNTLHSTGFTVNNINTSGVITATSFIGDGSGLTGVAAAGLGSALSDDTNSPLNLIYKTPKVLNVGAAVSITVESDETSGYVAYMPAGSVHVAVGGTVRVALGTTVKTNILGVFD